MNDLQKHGLAVIKRVRREHIANASKPHGGTACDRDEAKAKAYALWLVARDGVELPDYGEVRVEWNGILSAYRTKRNVDRWTGETTEAAVWCKRISAVLYGHKKDVYNTRKNGSRGAWLYSEFVTDFRVELPNWEFEPRPAELCAEPELELELERAA